ncbi:MAG: DUF5711 family protein [Defluviitaleaceae bacterium]|nr:DUF5711 family protein [Defluviitaleaceae bacterium]
MSDTEKKIKKSEPKKKPVRILVLAASVFLVIAVVQNIAVNGLPFTGGGASEMFFSETGKGVSFDYDSAAQFYSYNSGNYFFCTKDGMKYYSSGGTLRWQHAYNLTRPYMVTNGGTVAVGDETKAKHIYVFGPNGFIYDRSFDEPVLFFSVNEAGYLSVVRQIDRGYDVQIHSGRGIEPFRRYFYDANIYPYMAAASEDGRYAAIVYLDLQSHFVTRIDFHMKRESDSWGTHDGLFGGERFDNQLITCVRFMSGNKVLIFTDTQIICFTPGDGHTLERSWDVQLHNKIDKLDFYGHSRFAYVTGDKFLNDDDADEPGTVKIFNMDGSMTGSFAVGRRCTSLSMGLDSVIAGADRSYYAFNARGNFLWEYNATQDTNMLIFLENTDTVLLSAGNGAVVLKRTK